MPIAGYCCGKNPLLVVTVGVRVGVVVGPLSVVEVVVGVGVWVRVRIGPLLVVEGRVRVVVRVRPLSVVEVASSLSLHLVFTENRSRNRVKPLFMVEGSSGPSSILVCSGASVLSVFLCIVSRTNRSRKCV